MIAAVSESHEQTPIKRYLRAFLLLYRCILTVRQNGNCRLWWSVFKHYSCAINSRLHLNHYERYVRSYEYSSSSGIPANWKHGAKRAFTTFHGISINHVTGSQYSVQHRTVKLINVYYMRTFMKGQLRSTSSSSSSSATLAKYYVKQQTACCHETIKFLQATQQSINTPPSVRCQLAAVN